MPNHQFLGSVCLHGHLRYFHFMGQKDVLNTILLGWILRMVVGIRKFMTGQDIWDQYTMVYVTSKVTGQSD